MLHVKKIDFLRYILTLLNKNLDSLTHRKLPGGGGVGQWALFMS